MAPLFNKKQTNKSVVSKSKAMKLKCLLNNLFLMHLSVACTHAPTNFKIRRLLLPVCLTEYVSTCNVARREMPLPQLRHCLLFVSFKLLGQCNPWTKSLGPLDLGLVQVGLHWCNPWTSYLLDQTYTGTLGN